MLTIFNSAIGNEILLTSILLQTSTDNNHFTLEDSNNSIVANINFIPILDQSYNYIDFNIYFFKNSYLVAENDVFQVNETSLKAGKQRIGWMFPITILESNNNDYVNDQFLNKYKYIAYQLLFHKNNTKIPAIRTDNWYKLSDFFDENIILLITSNSVTQNIPDFNLIDYFPSFSDWGFYEWDANNSISFEAQKKLILKNRGKPKIRITKAKYDIKSDDFILALYKNYLKINEHQLLRFHFLYQVIELLIEKKFETEFDTLILTFQNNQISKNDLREELVTISKERELIRNLFSSIKFDDEVKTDLSRDCKFLLDHFKVKERTELADKIYDVRNLLVHRYRDISKNINDIEILDEIVAKFEIIINTILINYSP